MKKTVMFIIISIILLVIPFVSAGYVYQENANSTLFLNGSGCVWTNRNNAIDGDYTTYASYGGPTDSCYLIVNYSLPINRLLIL